MSLRETFKQLETALHDLVSMDTLLPERLDQAILKVVKLNRDDFPPDLREEYDLLADMIRLYQDDKYLPEIELEITQAILQLFTNLVSSTGMIKT